MINRIFKARSEFSRNIIVLMSGTMIAQALPIALSPILTRLYSPSEFGTYGLYLAIVGIVSSLATGRYELSIMLPKKETDAINLVVLSLLITLSVSLILALVVVLFNRPIVAVLGNENISLWLYFLPISVAIAGIFQSLKYWNTRKKQYKRLAGTNVLRSSATATTNLSFGLSGLSSSGLILGNIFGHLIASIFLVRKSVEDDKKILLFVNQDRVLLLAKKYIKFPKFDTPAALTFSVYSNMTVIFFNKFFEAATAGYYFFANRLLKLPFSFFVSSFSDVFYQHLSQETSSEKIANEINKFSIKLVKIILVPFILVVYSSKYYVGIVFGEEWIDLYKYMYIFSLPILLSLCLSPYGHALKIIDRQDVSMMSHFARLIVLSLYFLSYFVIDYNLLVFVYIFSLLDSLMHIILAFVVDFTIKNMQIMKMSIIRLSIWASIAVTNYLLLI